MNKMNFLRKHLSNILFFGFLIFLFTPYGMPVRTGLIRVISLVTTRVLPLGIDQEGRERLSAYDWELISRDGIALSMENLKGKVIVINYWATWCPPCIAEMPAFQDLYDAYKKDVVFLFVTNDDREKVERFIKKHGYSLPVYYPRSRPPVDLESSSLPTTYFLDRQGGIAVHKVGAADWKSGRGRRLLDELLE